MFTLRACAIPTDLRPEFFEFELGIIFLVVALLADTIDPEQQLLLSLAFGGLELVGRREFPWALSFEECSVFRSRSVHAARAVAEGVQPLGHVQRDRRDPVTPLVDQVREVGGGAGGDRLLRSRRSAGRAL